MFLSNKRERLTSSEESSVSFGSQKKNIFLLILTLTLVSSLSFLFFYSVPSSALSTISLRQTTKASEDEDEDDTPIKDTVDLSFTEEDHRKLSRQFATEGMILAKNSGLPIQPTDKVVLFGKGTTATVYGGWGSGEVYNKGTKDNMTPVKVLEGIENKSKEKKFIYEKNEKDYELSNKLTESDIEKFGDKGDAERSVAVMTISRRSGEGGDRGITQENNGVLITDSELRTFTALEKYFDHVVIVLNVGSVMEIEKFIQSKKTSILISYLPGMEAGNAIADILVGDVNPSGRLTDTWAKKIEDYPTTNTFKESISYVKYLEGIFVGYRYFEDNEDTQSKVVFPFGWGLSYTTFEMSSEVEYKNEVFRVLTTVKNTGKVAGKQVVQVYVEKPANEKFVKAKRELVAFSKTKELEPGEKKVIVSIFDLKQLSSYDSTGVTGNKACYVLEKGDYNIYVGANVAETRDEKTLVYTHTVEKDTVIEKLSNLLTPKDKDISDSNTKPDFDSFMKTTKTFSLVEKEDSLINEFSSPHLMMSLLKEEPEIISLLQTKAEPYEINFKTVVEGKNKMEELCSAMTDEELAFLTYGHGGQICAGTGVIGGTYPYGTTEKTLIPPADTMDGPAGLRQCERSLQSTAWPSSTLLASTFDIDIMEAVGLETGKEARKLGTSFWLAPGMNIHRSPLCGRNFEYYSEDPLLTGKLASAITKGLQKTRVSITLKHFGFNNKEQNRNGDDDKTNHLASDSRVSERAAREIYLKGFEIAIKEAHPWAIMTSYNRVNGQKTSANSDLLSGILRKEWGFNGLIMTDWGTNSNILDEINAGGNVKMPGVEGGSRTVLDGLKAGKIKRTSLEQSCVYICNTISKTSATDVLFKKPKTIDISKKIRIKVNDDMFAHSEIVGSERCEDEDGGNIPTHTENGAFVAFYVKNEKKGKRTVRVRFSGNAKGYGMQFMKGEDKLGEVLDLPATGGWQNWKTTDDFEVDFPEGKYELKIVFKCSGDTNAGNINWFEIDDP